MYSQNKEAKKLDALTIAFENCEAVRIPCEDILLLSIGDVTTELLADNFLGDSSIDVSKYQRAGNVYLTVHNKPEYHRIIKYDNIAQIHLEHAGGDIAEWYVVDYADTNGDLGEPNENQTTRYDDAYIAVVIDRHSELKGGANRMAEQAKVTLPKEVAEAIEEIRSEGFTDYAIVTTTDAFSPTPPCYPEQASEELASWTRGGNHDLLLSALVNGYEVEQSPEEELREYYEGLVRCEEECRNVGKYPVADEYYSRRIGVITTLNKLGIEIEGINDKKEDE